VFLAGLPNRPKLRKSNLPIVLGRRRHFEGVSASPMLVKMVPRTRLFLYGDPVFAEDKVCTKAANSTSARSLRGEVLSVRKCCCCHVSTILCAPLGNARTAAEAAAAAEEVRKVVSRCVGHGPLIVGGSASCALISPHNSHPEAISILLSFVGWVCIVVC